MVYTLFIGRARETHMQLIVMLMMVVRNAHAQVPPKEVQRINHGMIFQGSSLLDVSPDTWFHTVVVPWPTFHLPHTSTELPCNSSIPADMADNGQLRNNDLPRKMFTLSNTSEFELVSDEIKEIIHAYTCERSYLTHIIAEKNKELDLLLPKDPPTQFKQERAILGFIGSALHSLTGVALKSDVDKLEDHIGHTIGQATRVNEARIIQLENSVESIAKTESKTEELFKKAINYTNQKVNLYQRYFTKAIGSVVLNVTNLIIDLHSQGVLQVAALQNVYWNLNEHEKAVETLFSGKLPKYFVSPSHLDKILAHVSNTLPSHGNLKLIYTNHEHYYQMKGIAFARRGENLYIQLKLPISTENSLFYLYHAHIMPMPITPQHSHTTIIRTTKRHLAITQNMRAYLTLSDEELQQCEGHDIRRCQNFPLISAADKQNCLFAVFTDNLQAIKESCEVDLNTEQLSPIVWHLRETQQYVVYTGDQNFEISCPDRPVKPLVNCNLCIIKIPCKCNLQNDKQFFSPHITNCDTELNDVSVEHPINLPALMHFLPGLAESDFKADTYLKNEMVNDIPEIKIVSENLDNVINKEEINHASVKQIAESIKSNTKLYASTAQKLIEDLGYSSSVIVARTTPVISWVAATLSIVAIIMAVYTHCRVIVLAPVVRGFDFQFNGVIQSTTPEAHSEVSNMHHIVSYSSNALIALTIVATLFLAFKIYRSYWRQKAREKHMPIHTQIFAAFYSPSDVLTLPLMITPIHPTKINLVTLHKFVKPEMNGWTRLVFNWSFIGSPIGLPKLVKFPVVKHYTVKRFMQEMIAFRLIAVNADMNYEMFMWYKNRNTQTFRKRSASMNKLTLRDGVAVQSYPTAPLEEC